MANAVTKENLQTVMNNYFTKMNNKYDPQLSSLNARSIIGNELKNSYSLMSVNQNPVVGEFVQFATALDKGITVTNGLFNVVKGTTYRLACSICTASTTVAGYITFSFYNITTGQKISTSQVSESVNFNSYTSGDNNLEVTYEATGNDVIGVRIDAVSGAVNISSPYSYLIVEEKGRTYTVDPMDVQGDYTVPFATFTLAGNQTSGFTTNAYIKFDTTIVNSTSDIVLDPSTGIVTVPAGSYDINFSVLLTMTAAVSLQVYNVTDSVYIGRVLRPNAASVAENFNSGNSISFKYTFTKETKIAIGFVSVSGTITNLMGAYTAFNIQKIAQPVVVEYNKYNEVSNPLTTSPLEIVQIIYVGSSLTANQHITIDSSLSNLGNMVIENGGIKLTKDKLYRIEVTSFNANTTGTGGYGFFLCDVANNSIAQIIRTSPVTNTGNYAPSNSGSYYYQPTQDIDVSIMPSVAITSLYCTILVQEIRNEVVNQYGGFEKTVLFDGTANAIGNYTLADSIENYDFIVVTAAVLTGAAKQQMESNNIEPEIVVYGQSSQFSYNVSVDATNRRLLYYFNSSNVLSISAIMVDSGNTIMITRIVGYKGQLPTLLQGGEF